MPPTALLSFVDVHMAYHDGQTQRTVLRGASASLQAGEAVALLGRSGSGKSTLLALAAGLDAPAAGQVMVEGHDLAALGERQRTLLRRRRIGLVVQQGGLLAELTVGDHLLLRAALERRPRPSDHEEAREMLAAVGLAERWKAFPDQLSGGEQQRVAVAAALCGAPALVLADEPTGALDAATAEQVTALLVRLCRQAGRGLLLVTHDAAVAARADRLWRLEDGRIVPDAT